MVKGTQTRERILAEATRLFYRKGFGQTTVNDLLEATGTTKGSLYFHFSGKDEVACQVLLREGQNFLALVDDALGGDSPGAALDNFFRQALALHRSRGFVGGCLFGNTALEASDTDPELAGRVRAIFATWTERLGQNLRRAQQAGHVRDDLAAGQLAGLIVATLEGGIMQSRLEKSEAPLKDALDALRLLLKLKT